MRVCHDGCGVEDTESIVRFRAFRFSFIDFGSWWCWVVTVRKRRRPNFGRRFAPFMLFRESLVVNAKALTRNHFEAFISNGGSAAIAGAPPFANRSTQLTEESFFIKFPKETDSIRQKQTSGAKKLRLGQLDTCQHEPPSKVYRTRRFYRF